MILYIIRHAWASHGGDAHWPDDRQRPLTDEGQKRFAKMARTLADRGFAPKLVATSPLVRCRQTAEIVVENVAADARLVELFALAPGSDLAALLAWTKTEAEDCDEVAWVGHAPDVSHLAAAMLGASRGWIHFGKASVAAFEFEGLPRPGCGELRWLATAKLLGC